MEKKIDFVLLWVDGNDPAWLEQKNFYSTKKIDYSNNDNRFRDWDNLQYWFRGIEKFAPWVNNIYFITWGHLPKWLNTNHPKLKIINHQDYIPHKYLPTFNSDVIETNLHRIKDLAETFVLFNDDTFLIDYVRPEDFFVNEKPCDAYIESIIAPMRRINYTRLGCMSLINKFFSKKAIHRKNFFKIYNLKYGLKNLLTLYFLPFPYISGFSEPHLPTSHLKSTFNNVWDVAEEQLNESCLNKFRGYNDISHWLMRYWNLCNGDFEPRNPRIGKFFIIQNDNSKICSYIREKKGKMICVNDMSTDIDFEKAKAEINTAFDKILKEKSLFEK